MSERLWPGAEESRDGCREKTKRERKRKEEKEEEKIGRGKRGRREEGKEAPACGFGSRVLDLW